MIGKMIDRAAFSLLGTAGLYLFFLNAGLGVVGSGALALLCAYLAGYVIRHRPRGRGVSRARAEASLFHIAMMDEAGAREALEALTDAADAVYLVRHPDGVLTLDAFYAIWREQGDGTTVVATCRVQPEASAFARQRGMALIDREALVKRIRKTGLCAVDEVREEPMLARLGTLWSSVRVRPRMILYGLSLFGMYFATGQPLCLVCALAVLGVIGAKGIESVA